MRHKFYKLEGAGNDFVFIDDSARTFPLDPDLIRNLCHRTRGIGADGLVLLRPSGKADCRMVYFNSDGKEASFCGNALRCALLALQASGHTKNEFLIETDKGVMRCNMRGKQIETMFPTPMQLAKSLKVSDMETHLIDTGVPHAVIFVEDLHSLDVQGVGKKIRHDAQLGPAGANVTFVQPIHTQAVHIRTYERGVEGETLACGTGAVAAAFVMSNLHNSPSVSVKTRGGDQFEVDTVKWLLTGPARLVFEGTIAM